MKLHYNADTFSVGKVRKLKTAITAMGVKVEEVVHKTGDDLSKVSFFNTLPLLETPQGTIFSSNTILRFLASAHKPELYEGDVYNKTLIDQWMDFTTCDFEPVVAAILYHKEGRGVDLNKLEQDVTKILAYTNGHLKDKNFLVNNKFSIADITLGASVSVILQLYFNEHTRKKYGKVLEWYNRIVEVNKEIGPKELPKDSDESFKVKKGKKKEQK